MAKLKKGKSYVIGGTLITLLGAYLLYSGTFSTLTQWAVLVIGIVVWIYGDYELGVYKNL